MKIAFFEPEYEHIFYLDNTAHAVEDFITQYQDQLDVYMPALLRTVAEQ